jgi:hypothetical protein
VIGSRKLKEVKKKKLKHEVSKVKANQGRSG